MSVYGRPLGVREMKLMRIAKNIRAWVQQQEDSKEKGAWAMSNPDAADAISFARKCAIEMGYIEP